MMNFRQHLSDDEILNEEAKRLAKEGFMNCPLLGYINADIVGANHAVYVISDDR
jgi:hypothetical protein